MAEYSGLIAGLELAEQVAPGADIEVRMDSKLVVEQMSGNWKIKHPDMKPLALEANRLAPFGTTYTWVPREQNKHADRLANEALDGAALGVSPGTRTTRPDGGRLAGRGGREPEPRRRPRGGRGYRGWSPPEGPVTTLVLVRHGATAHTADKRFSGGLASSNPGLTDEGRAQVREVAEWLAPLGEAVDAVVASPVRRTRESAEILAERLGLDLVEEPGFAEMEFGAWDGLTFAEVRERYPDELEAWLGALDVAPRRRRVVPRGREAGPRRAASGCSTRYAGKTVVVVSHVTPIKTLVAHAVDAPLSALFRMELSTGVGERRVVLPAAEDGTSRGRRCGSTTRSRPAPGGCSTRPQRWSASRPVRAR